MEQIILRNGSGKYIPIKEGDCLLNLDDRIVLIKKITPDYIEYDLYESEETRLKQDHSTLEVVADAKELSYDDFKQKYEVEVAHKPKGEPILSGRGKYEMSFGKSILFIGKGGSKVKLATRVGTPAKYLPFFINDIYQQYHNKKA